jgi:hypothetical protein
LRELNEKEKIAKRKNIAGEQSILQKQALHNSCQQIISLNDFRQLFKQYGGLKRNIRLHLSYFSFIFIKKKQVDI